MAGKRKLSDEQIMLIEKLTRDGEWRPSIAREVTKLYETSNKGNTCSTVTVWKWQKKMGLI